MSIEEDPGAKQIAGADLTKLNSLLESTSKGRYKQDMAVKIRNAAKKLVRLIYAMERSRQLESDNLNP